MAPCRVVVSTPIALANRNVSSSALYFLRQGSAHPAALGQQNGLKERWAKSRSIQPWQARH